MKKMKRESSIDQLEATLSEHNSKTVNLEGFKAYLLRRKEVSPALYEFYGNIDFRSWRLSCHISKQKSEARLLRNFKQTYGGPDEVFLAWGDWQETSPMKNREPSLGVGLKRIFRRGGLRYFPH
jgi:hypothetical protein